MVEIGSYCLSQTKPRVLNSEETMIVEIGMRNEKLSATLDGDETYLTIGNIGSNEYIKSIKVFVINILSKFEGKILIKIRISEIEKYLLGVLIGILIRSDSFKVMQFEYNISEYEFEGVKLEEKLTDQKFNSFLADQETTVSAIPYCEGKFRPTPYRSMAHLVGLDAIRTRQILAEHEPKTVVNIGEKVLTDVLVGFHDSQINIDRTSMDGAVTALRDWYSENGQEVRYRRSFQRYVLGSGWKPNFVAAVIWSVCEAEVPVLIPYPDFVVPITRRFTGDIVSWYLTDKQIHASDSDVR